MTNNSMLSPDSALFSNDHLAPLESKRKFSFPVTLHSSSFLTEVSTLSARRRLSNVGDAVTRKLSNTIGWKVPPIPTQDIVTQGKCLCGQYIRSRLKRSGVFNKKLGLQRIRSIVGTPSIHIVREVFPTLSYIGEELERMHPAVYTGVARQISRTTGTELPAIEATTVLLSAVARDLFRTDISWAKIVSLFAIAGGLAVDCVRQGHPEYLPKLIEGVGEVIEDELVTWINENGGWTGLTNHVSPETTAFTSLEWITLIIGCAFGICFIYVIVKFIGYHLLFKLINR